MPPHDTYDARVAAQQRIYDPSVAPRRAVEDAQLAESQSRLRVALLGVRQSVNDAFFTSLHAQPQLAGLHTTNTGHDAQPDVFRLTVDEAPNAPVSRTQ